MNENELELNKNNNKWNYISVIFENRVFPFSDTRIINDEEFRNSIYGNSTQYTYKVKEGEIENLVEGRILKIENKKELSRVLVTKTNLKESDINFPIDKIKEIPLYKEVK